MALTLAPFGSKLSKPKQFRESKQAFVSGHAATL